MYVYLHIYRCNKPAFAEQADKQGWAEWISPLTLRV
jgi:hypothetical protein